MKKKRQGQHQQQRAYQSSRQRFQAEIAEIVSAEAFNRVAESWVKQQILDLRLRNDILPSEVAPALLQVLLGAKPTALQPEQLMLRWAATLRSFVQGEDEEVEFLFSLAEKAHPDLLSPLLETFVKNKVVSLAALRRWADQERLETPLQLVGTLELDEERSIDSEDDCPADWSAEEGWWSAPPVRL